MRVHFQHTGIQNLYTRDGIYYYRRQMTGAIKQLLGLSEIRRSLKTGNLKEARLRCAYIDIRVKMILGNTEHMLSENITPEMKQIARDYFKRELQECLDELDLSPAQMKSVTGDKLVFDHKSHAATISSLFDKYSEMATNKQFNASMVREIKNSFEELGEDIPSINSNAFGLMGSVLCRAQAEAYRIYHAHLTSKFTDLSPQDTLFINETSSQILEEPHVPLKTLDELLIEHKEAKDAEITISTKQDFDRLYGWMREWFGTDTPISGLNKKDFLTFRDMLKQVPNNYKKLKAYKNLKLAEVIEKSIKAKKVSKLSISTQKKYLSLVKAVFSWAADEDILTPSPADGIKVIVPKNKPAKIKRLPFSTHDMCKILYSPLFIGFNKFNRKYEEGPIKLQTDDYWAWLVAFMSGLRIKEITMLHRRDIKELDGVLLFDVNNDHGKGIKTSSSIRQVPIHYKLLELGLLEWIKKTTKGKPNKLIFPSLIGKQEKDYSKPATSRLNNYRKTLGFTARDKTFHSTRHTIADELRNQNLEEYSISKIMGHSKTDVTSGYGSGTSLQVLKKYIDGCYENFDFEPLKQMKL